MVSEQETAQEMFVTGLLLDPNTQSPVIVLQDETGKITLPIWIGVPEATSIAATLKQVEVPRPLTHDLLHGVLRELGARVERVVITDLQEGTYYAEVSMSHGDKALLFDARPSDAVAIALRESAPIYVFESVIAKAQATLPPELLQNLSTPQLPEPEGSTEKGESESSGVATDDKGEKGEQETSEEEDEYSVDFKNIKKEEWEEILKKLDPDDFKYKV